MRYLRIFAVALLITLICFAATAEPKGDRIVDFHCASLAALKSAEDPDTRIALVENGYCDYMSRIFEFTVWGNIETSFPADAGWRYYLITVTNYGTIWVKQP